MSKRKPEPAPERGASLREAQPAADIISPLIRAGLRALGRSFYGGIFENCRTAPMGKGHNNDDKPFDLETACYLKPVLTAIGKEGTRKIVIKAGVKTLKSFVVEISAAHHLCHSIGDVTIYFGTGEMADDQSTTRILDYFEGIPSYRQKMATVKERFDFTQSAVKFPDKTFRIKPANLPNTQGVNLGFVGVCDAFVTERSGMIDQAIARTTQYPDDKKIILESQGGETGFDFDRHYEDTDQGELHVICPACGSANLWNWKGWHRERPDDFKAVLPHRVFHQICHPDQGSALQGADRFGLLARSLPALQAARDQLTASLLAADRRNSGFKRGDEAAIRLEDGTYNEREILRLTYYECYFCGEAWRDTPETRAALDVSSHYLPSRLTALAGNVGFNFPQWINRRLPWGEMMLAYLVALKNKRQFGIIEPLKQWWQKTAGRTWEKDIEAVRAPVITGSYEVRDKIPDEVCRVMFVDCQQDDGLTATTGKSTMGKFWWVARAIDKSGNMFQLARGWGSREDWQAEQKRLEISNENLGIDGGFWRSDVIELAARFIAPYVRRIRKHGRWREETVLHTYTVLVGNGKRVSWKHPDGHSRAISTMQAQSRFITFKSQPMEIKVPLYEWSNLSIKDQLADLIRGGDGRVQYKSLARSQIPEAIQLKEAGNLTYENQMNAEYRTQNKKGDPYWEKSRPDNHYLDCECGCLALFGLGGFLGVTAAPEAAANEG